ncbi:MAG: hypothetical protein GOMPHAMPRED_001849 [Gomphillus americanus]|uniref:Sld7 C-terminal domain-containing protein n=1 Tax=Gomphillus americanus TaxID=1940652 RepID=A0A8H3F7S6_9LECA|nr:MAG: hypothetical protein GOMPHAMPRED_001849 [Gomphillus americanus]
MEPIWNGDLLLTQGDLSRIHQIQFFAQKQGVAIPLGSRLSFLSFVYCTQIPLHIVCGPAYEVIAPRNWLYETIANTLPCSTNEPETKVVTESELGALVRVEHEDDGKRKHGGIEVTEFLLYASRDYESRSSSDTLAPDILGLSEYRIFALPLSSHMLYDPNLYELPPTPPAENHSSIIAATVLKPLTFDRSQKRQRLNDLFQDAAKTRRRPLRKDSQDLTHLVSSRPQSPLLSFDREAEVKGLDKTKATKSHSRSHSLTFVHEDRPRSRGLPFERARSSLSRVTSTSTLLKLDLEDGEIPALQDGRSTVAIADKNKKALSGIVLAGMRMRGMTQRRRKDEEGPDDLEYKLVYHNAFKAASFALRAKLDNELSSEAVREVVDVLLDLFCGNEGFEVTHEGFR